MELETFATNLRTLAWGLGTCGRLEALRQLGESTLIGKRAAAARSVELIEAAFAVHDFVQRHYIASPWAVQWTDDTQPELTGSLKSGRVQADALSEEIALLLRRSSATLAWVIETANGDELLRPAASALRHIQARLPEPAGAQRLGVPSVKKGKNSGSRKTLCGPTHVDTDPAFEPTYSLLKRPVSTFGETLENNVPYFWSLAIRESLAADLCALSSVEYDGMPLEFYRDMAKQAWDEMRHSTYFFDLALSMIPELRQEMDEANPFYDNLRRFQTTGSGLPIPRERNLYEAILNASLVERLILLHRDTETPGILRIKEKIDSIFCRVRPQIAAALEIVLRDEVTHSRFGNVWLKYLLPDGRIRDEAINTTELLRGVLLLSAFAHHGEETLGDLLKRYSGGEIAPISPLQLNTV